MFCRILNTPLLSKITNANLGHWFHKQKVYYNIDANMEKESNAQSAFIYVISYGKHV